MERIHGCHVTSREAMLFMKYEHYCKCKGSFKDSQRNCKYFLIKFDGNIFLNRLIMKTRSYNFDHLICKTFIKKDWGSDRGIHYFTLFLLKNRLWVYPQFIFEQKKTKNKTRTTKLSQFSSENCHFYSRKNSGLTVWAC